MLKQYWTTTFIWQDLSLHNQVRQVETCTGTTVKDQKHYCRNQNRERKKTHNSSKEKCPNSQRHFPHIHTFCTQVQNRTDIIYTAQNLGNNKQYHTKQPK